MKLEIKNLHASIDGEKILSGISLVVNPGEIHALMGPNGSGKSTLSHVLAGDPRYKIENGDILINDKSILNLSPDERSKLGLFILFQQPIEIPGLSFVEFLFTLAKKKDKNISLVNFKKNLDDIMKKLGITKSFIDRDLNVGFSGGEKKRAEVLQLLTLQPSLAVLDEMDSGLDVDTMKILADAINTLRSSEFSSLIITHYQRLLDHIKPDVVHIMSDGKIIATGNHELSKKVESEGYAGWAS